MSLLSVTRGDFTNRYDKSNTKNLINAAFGAWDCFLGSRNIAEPDMLIELRKDENKNKRYVLLDQFVQYMKTMKRRTKYDADRSIDVATIKMYFQYVKAWLRYNEIELNDEKIKENIRFPKKLKERVRGIDGNMILNLIDRCSPFYRGIWYVLAYGGGRIKSEMLNMQWSWVDFDKSPLQITIPASVTKTSEERITFLGLEAEQWLREQRKARGNEGPDEFVFRKQRRNGKWHRITYSAAYKYFRKRRIDLGYNDKSSTGRHHFRPHKLRAYTESMISRSVGEEFAHAITGHGQYLGQYFAGGTSDDQAREDYKRAMSSLALSETSKLKNENEKLKGKLAVVDQVKRQSDMLVAFLQAHPQLAEQFKRFAAQ